MATTARREKPPYNPAILRWARERRGQSLEEVAQRLGQSPERVAAWEDPNASQAPTVKQARTLADLYGRAFIEFFLAEPPHIAEPTTVPDFRTHRGIDSPREHLALRDIQVWAEAQRENALDLVEELGESPPSFPGSLFATPNTKPDEAAAAARHEMDFSTSQEAAQLPNLLRQKLEGLGILTLKNTSIRDIGARGLCLVQFPLPTVVFGNEAPSAQAFTLAHELGHVIRRQSGVIAPLAHRNEGGKSNVEAWCDQFAAAFLMPKEAVIGLAGKIPTDPQGAVADERLNLLAKTFRVSPHAMLIRLVHLGYVSRQYYWDVKKADLEREEGEYQSFGRPAYYGTRYKNALGDLYTGLVIEAWSNGRITNHNAAQYMGIKNLRHLYDMRDHFGVG